MNIFLKAVGGILIAVLLSLSLTKQGKDFSILLIIAVCTMVASVALAYFQPVIDFVTRLQDIGQLDGKLVSLLMKAVGIGIIAEVTGLICTDAGNAALGKIIHVLASVVILCFSIPLFEELLTLVEGLLGAV